MKIVRTVVLKSVVPSRRTHEDRPLRLTSLAPEDHSRRTVNRRLRRAPLTGASALIILSIALGGCSSGRNTNPNQPAAREASVAGKEQLDRLTFLDFGLGFTPVGTITVDSCGITGVNTSINFVADDPGLRCAISRVILYEVTVSSDARTVAAALDRALADSEIRPMGTFTDGSYAGAIADGEDWVAQTQGGDYRQGVMLQFFRPGPTHADLLEYTPSGALEKLVDRTEDTPEDLTHIARTSKASFIFTADWTVEYFDNSITGTD